MSMTELTSNPNCLCHGEDRLEKLLELPQARAKETTARQLLSLVEAETGWANLNLELGRVFVVDSVCSECDRHIELNRVLYRVRDVDIVCPTCSITCPTCEHVSIGQPDCPNCGQQDISEPRLVTFHTISPGETDMEPYLDYTLADLGIPPLHILTINNQAGQRLNVELTGDLASLWGESSFKNFK